MTNTPLLENRIEESGLKRVYIAEKMGLTPYGLAKKINGLNEFKSNEVMKLCEILGINSLKEKERIFFAQCVDNTATKG